MFRRSNGWRLLPGASKQAFQKAYEIYGVVADDLANLHLPEGGMRLLPWQLLDELPRPLNPAGQRVIALDAFRRDQNPALHRPAGDVELLDVRLLQRLVAPVRAEPHDERVLPHVHQKVAVEQEADAAEHLLLFDVLAPAQPLPDAPSQCFVEGHHSLQPLPPLESSSASFHGSA